MYNETILKECCNTDCMRFRQGDCPFCGRWEEDCPRVREYKNNIKRNDNED